MFFGKKKKVETPVEDIPPLPTLETLHQENYPTQPNIPQSAVPQPIAPKATQPQPRFQLQMPAIAADGLTKAPPKELQPAKAQEGKVERPAFAPLFIKIDRYRNILNVLGQLRTSIVMIRNSFSTLNELEKARLETLRLIEEAVGKVESKLSSLDTELLRPTSAHMDVTPEYQDVETVQATVADLKGQVEQLKAELEQLS